MIGDNWGATDAERAAQTPCDALVTGDVTRADRAVTVAAPPRIVFAWLCQLRTAPYSYDLLDNLGRRSPRTRNPDLTRLAVGQRFMAMFTLHSFAAEDHVTLRSGLVAVTYAVRPVARGTRLHVRVRFAGPWPARRLLAMGDLMMMRKQLLTLRRLAEHEAETVTV